jgi:hypothetical protein
MSLRDDPIFGPMYYMGDRLRYWECKVVFAPLSSVIEVFVDGSADDIMEIQHRFFEQFLDEWPRISEAIAKILLRTWQERKSGTRAESPWDIFRLSSLSIPSASINDAEWEISFAALPDADHLWSVRMVGREPREVTIDG